MDQFDLFNDLGKADQDDPDKKGGRVIRSPTWCEGAFFNAISLHRKSREVVVKSWNEKNNGSHVTEA